MNIATPVVDDPVLNPDGFRDLTSVELYGV